MARLAPSTSPPLTARVTATFAAGHAKDGPAHGDLASPMPTSALAAAGAATRAVAQHGDPVSNVARNETESASGAAPMLHETASVALTAKLGSASGASTACAAALNVVGDNVGSEPRSEMAMCWHRGGSCENGPGLPRFRGSVGSLGGGGTRAKNGASSVSTDASACASGADSSSPSSPSALPPPDTQRAATVCIVRSARFVVPGSPCLSSHNSRAKGRSQAAAVPASTADRSPPALLAATRGRTAASNPTHATRRSGGPVTTASLHTAPTESASAAREPAASGASSSISVSVASPSLAPISVPRSSTPPPSLDTSALRRSTPRAIRSKSP